MRAMSSFGRIRHKIRRFGGNSKAATPCARITPVVALEGVLYFPSGRCGAASNVLGATPVQPRRVRESRPLWCRIRAAPLSGGSVTNPVCWRQLRYDPLRVRESRLSWRLDGHRPLSGVRCESGNPGVRSSVATYARIKRLRLSWPGCVLQLLRRLQDDAKAPDSSPCCHAPCEISHRNVSMRTTSLSGGAVRELRRAPVKRTTPLSGGAAPGPCR
jgi:hypothetical protein